jgi:hypothetical protein
MENGRLFEFDGEFDGDEQIEGLLDNVLGSDSSDVTDDDENEETESEDGSLKRDKIFDNSYGEVDHYSGPISFTVDSSYHSYGTAENSYDYDILFREIEKIILSSEFASYNDIDEEKKAKKLNKMQINQVYTYILSNLTVNHRKIEVFSILSDYFDIYPNKLYSSLSNKYKNELIMELDKSTNILQKKKIRKLF